MKLDFTAEIAKILREYGDEVMGIVEEEAEAAGKRAAKELRNTSPKREGPSGGGYAKGWTSKKDGKTVIVYNRAKPGLAHLLENGYQGRKKYVEGTPHIAPVEEKQNEEFYDAVVGRLK